MSCSMALTFRHAYCHATALFAATIPRAAVRVRAALPTSSIRAAGTPETAVRGGAEVPRRLYVEAPGQMF